MLKVYNFV